jgi:lysophospholipase L1-like esterase
MIALAIVVVTGFSTSIGQTPTPSAPGAQPSPVAAPIPEKPRTAEDAITPTLVNPTMSTMNPSYNMNRHERIMKEKSKGEIGLLFIGDSITDFFPGKAKETWAKYAPYKPADFGVGGDRTENVLWRITNGELDGLHPKVTVIMIGTNNIGQCPTEKPEWAAAGVKKIVDTVHEKIPGTKVLLLGVFPRGEKPNDPHRLKVAEINKIISKLDDGSNTRYLDITKAFLDTDGTLIKEAIPGLHPTEKGYEIWYEQMKPTLDEMMK